MLVNKSDFGYFFPFSAKLQLGKKNTSSGKHTHTGGGTRHRKEKTALLTPAALECPLPHPAAEVGPFDARGATGAAAVASHGVRVLPGSPPVTPARRPGAGGKQSRSRGGPGTTKRAVKPPGGGCICCPVCEVRWLPGPGRSQCCCGH